MVANNPNELVAQVRWYVEGTKPYVRATMRHAVTGEFLSEAHVEEPLWRDRPTLLAAENKALDFAARVALRLV
jgi:hypothetical protein